MQESITPPHSHEKWYKKILSFCLINEFIIINKLAWPCVVSCLAGQLFPFISLLFTGHIGPGVYLDGTGLALSFANVTGTSFILGFSSGMDTLCSQAYGGKNYRLVGVYFQRAILLSLLVCFPIWALWLNAESILILLHQDAAVAAVAGKYLRILCVAKPAVMMYFLAKIFLETQNVMKPSIFINIIGDVVNIGCHYFFVIHLGFGVEGSAISISIAYWSLAIMYVLYIRCSSLYHTSWPGWTMDSLKGWFHYCKYGVPGMVMLCLEWWTFEIGYLVVGATSADPKVAIGIFSIMFYITVQIFMVPLGFTIAATVRIGNLLGANNPALARKSAYLCLCILFVIGLHFSVGVFILRPYLPLLFTTDPCIIAGASKALFITAVYVNFDGFRLMLGGILKGCGRQSVGSITNLIVYQFFGAPLAICLSVVFKLDTAGYWTGMTSAILVQAVIFFLLVICTNWEKESEKAQKNVGLSQPIAENNSQLSQYTQQSSESTSLLTNDIKPCMEVGKGGVSFRDLVKVSIVLLFIACFAIGLGFYFKSSHTGTLPYIILPNNTSLNTTEIACPY